MAECSLWQPHLQNRCREKRAHWNSIRWQQQVEQAALAREHAAFGVPRPAAGATLDGDGEPTLRILVPTALRRPQLKKERCTRLQDTRLIEAGVNGALQRERRTSRT